MNNKAFFISDGTGITAESLGHSLLSRFSKTHLDQITLPYINTEERAHQTAKRINDAAAETGEKPIALISIVSLEYREIIKQSNGLILDMFEAFLAPMEELLGCKADERTGSAFAIAHTNYHQRILAVNFALDNDDGGKTNNYSHADVIVIGLSRSGKTPTCLYLGMQFGISAANFPITEEDLDDSSLPKALQPHRKKLFGLLIDPKRLSSIREERYPNSRYASMNQCEFETRQYKAVLERYKIPHLDSTHLSIEELSTRIMDGVGIERRLRS